MQIEIVTTCSWGDKLVDAEIVDVAPHLAHLMTFAVGRNPDTFWPLESYRLHNVETGLAVHECDAKTKAAVLRKARAFLATITTDKAERALKAWRRVVMRRVKEAA